MQIVKFESVEDMIIDIRGEKVILDTDVAALYGVETKRINEVVKNNPEKFPEGYIMSLIDSEKIEPVENFDRFNKLKHSSADLKAFTEKDLYMLATIIKSPKAVRTTRGIIETYAKIKDLSMNIGELPNIEDKVEQKSIMERTGRILGDILDDAMETAGSETTLELNFAVLKVKHTIKKEKKR